MSEQAVPSGTKQVSSPAPIWSHVSVPEKQLGPDAIGYLKAYARDRPEIAALWCFGIGFVLSWKLKPW